MRFSTTDTRSLRRYGAAFLAFAFFVAAAGLAKTLYLVGRGARIEGSIPEWLFLAMFIFVFGGTGLHLIREARALDYEAAHRPGPERPLRPAPGLRRRRSRDVRDALRPRSAQSP